MAQQRAPQTPYNIINVSWDNAKEIFGLQKAAGGGGGVKKLKGRPKRHSLILGPKKICIVGAPIQNLSGISCGIRTRTSNTGTVRDVPKNEMCRTSLPYHSRTIGDSAYTNWNIFGASCPNLQPGGRLLGGAQPVIPLNLYVYEHNIAWEADKRGISNIREPIISPIRYRVRFTCQF